MLHCLEIKDRTIYLDGIRVKGVTGYEIKGSAQHSTELTLKLIVEDSKANSPEIISPVAALKKLTGGTMTGTFTAPSIKIVADLKDMDEQGIREIVKEELAALAERPLNPFKIDAKILKDMFNSCLQADGATSDKAQEDGQADKNG